MIQDKQEIIKLAKWLVNFLDEHNIWYTVDCGTLLGTIREKGMISWDDDFDIMMIPESFNELKRMLPEKIIDSNHKDYPLMIPKFLNNRNDFLNTAVFVDIFLLVPTTEKRIKKFTSLKNKLKFAMQCVHGTWKSFNFASKIFKIMSWPFKRIPKKLTYEKGIEILYEKNNPTHFFTIDNPTDPIIFNKQEVLSMKRQKVKYEDFNVYVPNEYEKILINKYGLEYMTPKKHFRSIEHINAVSIKKVKRK